MPRFRLATVNKTPSACNGISDQRSGPIDRVQDLIPIRYGSLPRITCYIKVTLRPFFKPQNVRIPNTLCHQVFTLDGLPLSSKSNFTYQIQHVMMAGVCASSREPLVSLPRWPYRAAPHHRSQILLPHTTPGIRRMCIRWISNSEPIFEPSSRKRSGHTSRSGTTTTSCVALQ